MFEACLRAHDGISLNLVSNAFFNKMHSLSFRELRKFAVLENSGLERTRHFVNKIAGTC